VLEDSGHQVPLGPLSMISRIRKGNRIVYPPTPGVGVRRLMGFGFSELSLKLRGRVREGGHYPHPFPPGGGRGGTPP
jgi:hypothetical protein